jgi:hypothetical protein
VISSEGNDAELTKNQGLEYDAQVSKHKNIIAKWALQWKSVIRSGFGQTLYPYGLYIRVLDLENFKYLLEDNIFRDFLLQDFFAGDMAQFLKTQSTPVKRKTGKGAKSVYSKCQSSFLLHVESVKSLVGMLPLSYCPTSNETLTVYWG